MKSARIRFLSTSIVVISYSFECKLARQEGFLDTLFVHISTTELKMARRVIIGVDVGGTNTDAVLIDVDLAETDPVGSIVATHKCPTTAQTTVGILNSMRHVITNFPASDSIDILSVNIGTTVSVLIWWLRDSKTDLICVHVAFHQRCGGA